uniref:Uncharacterized protein n=1 Tax=Salix viminalis TaxID=40686 RepID=A0A6N2LWU8_SALVM
MKLRVSVSEALVRKKKTASENFVQNEHELQIVTEHTSILRIIDGDTEILKIKDRLLERQFTLSNVARSVGYTAKEARGVTGDGSFVMIDNKKDERNAGTTFGSAISTENFGDSTSKHRREYDRYTSRPFRNEHKTNRTLISKEQLEAWPRRPDL